MSKAKDNFYRIKSICSMNVINYVDELELKNAELMDAFTELLQDAMYLYQYDPNNFRKTQEKYFKQEIDILNKYKEK